MLATALMLPAAAAEAMPGPAIAVKASYPKAWAALNVAPSLVWVFPPADQAIVGPVPVAVYGQSLHAELYDARGPLAGRQIVFSTEVQVLCAAWTDANGKATCLRPLRSTPPLDYTADFAGDDDHWSAYAYGSFFKTDSFSNSQPVGYSDGLGLEQFYPYDDVDFGSVQGYVNLRNGNLVARQVDHVIPGEGLNVVVSRTYNSQSRRDTGLGPGWTLGVAGATAGLDDGGGRVTGFDANSPVTVADILETDTSGVTRVMGKRLDLIDADGTSHRFIRYGNTGARWKSPPGVDIKLGEVLIGGAVVEAYEFTRPDGVVYRAEPAPAVAGVGITPWRVVEIRDRNSNRLTLEYQDLAQSGTSLNSFSQLRSITHSRTGAEKLVELAYNSDGRVETITALPASHPRRTLLTYSGGQVASVVENDQVATLAAGRRVTAFGHDPVSPALLTSITDPRLNTTQLGLQALDGAPRLTSITDRRGKLWRWAYKGIEQWGERRTVAMSPLVTDGYLPGDEFAPRAGQTVYRTSSAGNIISTRDAGNDYSWVGEYFGWSDNRLTTRQDGFLNQWSMTYNDLGLLTSVTEPPVNDPANTFLPSGSSTTPVTSVLEYTFLPDSKYPGCSDPAPTGSPVTNEGYCYQIADMRRVRNADNQGSAQRITDFRFDERGNVTGVIQRVAPIRPWADPPSTADRSTIMSYYSSGALRTVDGPRPTTVDTTTYGTVSDTLYGAYHRSGQPLSITDAAGAATNFAYNSYGKTVSRTDRDAKVTTTTYDERDNEIRIERPGGRVTTIAYDGNEMGTTRTSPRGNVTYANDFETRWVYDANGWETERSEPGADAAAPRPKATTTYNDDGTVAAEVSPRPATTTYAYYPNRSLASVTAPAGTGGTAVTSHFYDQAGRITRTDLPTAAATGVNDVQFEYTPQGDIAARHEAAALGPRTVRFAYNVHDEQIHRTGPLSLRLGQWPLETQTFDDLGQLTVKARWNGSRWLNTNTTYDEAGNVTTTRQPTGTGAQFVSSASSYDVLNRPTRDMDLAEGQNPGRETAFTYTAEGLQRERVDQVRDPVSGFLATHRTTTINYNPDNTVASRVSTDPTGTMAACNFAAGASPATGHDADGNLLITRTVLTGPGVAFGCDTGTLRASQAQTYDHRALPLTSTQAVLAPGGTLQTRTQAFTHNADETVASFTNAGDTTSYGYSPAGWMESLTDGTGRTAAATYRPTGQVAEWRLGVVGATAKATGTFGYRVDGTPAALTWKNGAALTVRSHASVTYDLAGQRTSEVVTLKPADGSADLTGTASYNYDLLDRLTSWTGPVKAAPTDSEAPTTFYYLNDGGDVTTEAVAVGSTVRERAFATLSNSRLASRVIQHAFDVGGNPAATDNESYAYSGLGEEATRTITATTGNNTRTSGYDAMGHTTKVDNTKTDQSDVEFYYDAMDRLVAKKETTGSTATPPSATVTQLYFYWGNSSSLVEEANASGAATERFTVTPDGNQLWSNEVSPARTVYLLDDLDGSMGTQLNEDGTVAEQKPYAPYGKPVAPGASRTTAAKAKILGFQKDMVDNATGFSFLGPRAYDSGIGRFLTPDTFVAADLDLRLGVDELTGNRYLFAGANPVAYYEDGHRPGCKGILRRARCGLRDHWRGIAKVVIVTGVVVATGGVALEAYEAGVVLASGVSLVAAGAELASGPASALITGGVVTVLSGIGLSQYGRGHWNQPPRPARPVRPLRRYNRGRSF